MALTLLSSFVCGGGAGTLYNCTDANSLVSFDPQTLVTSGKQERFAKFNPKIKGRLSTAHGQYDAARGEYVRTFPSFHTHTHTHTTVSQSFADGAGWTNTVQPGR